MLPEAQALAALGGGVLKVQSGTGLLSISTNVAYLDVVQTLVAKQTFADDIIVAGAAVRIRDGIIFDTDPATFETTLNFITPVANRLIYLPDASGTIALTSGIPTVDAAR